MQILCAIDPGSSTGLAIYKNGKLTELYTVDPEDVYPILLKQDDFVLVFEDSRLQRVLWPPKSLGINGAMDYARKVGYVDYQCREIERYCMRMDWKWLGISPKEKGSKVVNSQYFNKLTGWTGRTNQHQRDAGMIGYRFRHVVVFY